jgi:hypothetical protein
VARLILRWPSEGFDDVIAPAASWLELHAESLDDEYLWPLWDRIAAATLERSVEAPDE